MEIRFERVALYDEVWSTPLTKLGEKYGMSDNGIRKVCKAMDIPLPKVGHWARVEAGQVVTRTELPEEAERTTFVCRPPPRPALEFKRPEDEIWLEERRAFERHEENRIVVDPKPTRWHTTLSPFRDQLVSTAKAYAKHLEERERAKSRASRGLSRGPDLGALAALQFSNGMLTPRHQKSCFRVTSSTYERALAVANSLLFAAKQRSCTVGINRFDGFPAIELETTWMSFAIRERNPAGKLALVINFRFRSEFQFTDTEHQRIEDRLNQAYIHLYEDVVRGREYGRKEAVEQRVLAEERARQEEINRRLEQEARAKAAEVQRQNTLFKEAAHWQQAQQIRVYVADVMRQAGMSQLPELKAWEAWALQVAAEKDPAPSRLADLVERGVFP